MIQNRMKLYNAEVRGSGYDNYGQPITSFTFVKTVEVSISLLTKVINELDPRYIKSTHIGVSYDKTLIEGMKLISENDGNYMIKIANNDGRLSQFTLEVI